MSGFLKRIIAAHGGLERWNAFETVSTTIVSEGGLWATKGIVADNTPRRVTAQTNEEWTKVTPTAHLTFT
jgi:hypothetical protein